MVGDHPGSGNAHAEGAGGRKHCGLRTSCLRPVARSAAPKMYPGASKSIGFAEHSGKTVSNSVVRLFKKYLDAPLDPTSEKEVRER